MPQTLTCGSFATPWALMVYSISECDQGTIDVYLEKSMTALLSQLFLVCMSIFSVKLDHKKFLMTSRQFFFFQNLTDNKHWNKF